MLLIYYCMRMRCYVLTSRLCGYVQFCCLYWRNWLNNVYTQNAMAVRAKEREREKKSFKPLLFVFIFWFILKKTKKNGIKIQYSLFGNHVKPKRFENGIKKIIFKWTTGRLEVLSFLPQVIKCLSYKNNTKNYFCFSVLDCAQVIG